MATTVLPRAREQKLVCFKPAPADGISGGKKNKKNPPFMKRPVHDGALLFAVFIVSEGTAVIEEEQSLRGCAHANPANARLICTSEDGLPAFRRSGLRRR